MFTLVWIKSARYGALVYSLRPITAYLCGTAPRARSAVAAAAVAAAATRVGVSTLCVRNISMRNIGPFETQTHLLVRSVCFKRAREKYDEPEERETCCGERATAYEIDRVRRCVFQRHAPMVAPAANNVLFMSSIVDMHHTPPAQSHAERRELYWAHERVRSPYTRIRRA